MSLAKDIDYQLDLGLVIDVPVIGNFTIPLSQKGEVKLPTLSNMKCSCQKPLEGMAKGSWGS
ncbi:hypothetical protein JHK82_017713 [Glycine max]|nr:hypothetical protein JHK82_017713 [Glycine max]